MCGAILDAARLDPTVVIGGQIKSLGTGGRLGKGEFLVAETDESDRSFLLLRPTVAIVTNIDDEHMNAYRSRRDLEESFRRFVDSVPFYGLAIVCVDDPVVRQIAEGCKRRVLRYGFAEDADLRAVRVVPGRHGMEFDVSYRGANLGTFTLPMFGRHLVQNCLAAIAVGLEFNIPVDVIRSALGGFQGVKRRLEVIGVSGGVTVMNDYGHHPTEIRATLRAVRECFQGSIARLVVLFQPHRFTRTQTCWSEFIDCFKDADLVAMTEIYAASEPPIEGITGDALCSAIDHPAKRFVGAVDTGWEELLDVARPGDLVLCLGAGSVGAIPERLMNALEHRSPEPSGGSLVSGDSSAQSAATVVV
jgi:UDP-N-acetylmuramate--alanine ligase